MKTKITTTILAASLAITSAAASAQYVNTSEVSPTPTAEVTRTTRGSQHESSRKQLRGEYEGTWINYSTYDLLMVTRIDFDSRSMAEYGAELLLEGEMLEEAGFEVDGTIQVRIDGCEGLKVSADGLRAYVIVCVDDEFVSMIVGTDKQDALDVAEQMQDGYEPVVPAGYEEEL